ncbi:MAG TPA: glutamine amidotransferase [Verrucomicrobiae bacterium]
MTFASLIISARDWCWPAATLLAVSVILLLWAYVRAPAHKGLRTACAALKLTGLLALLACLLEPMWSGQRVKPGANLFAVVADNSQGLTIKDRGALRSRGEDLRELVAGTDLRWQEALAKDFQVRNYFFDARLQSTRDFSELAFDGKASAIGGTLRSLGQRYHGQPLAGILLLTDGIATDLGEGSFDFASLPPVYPVLIGKEETAPDLAIAKTSVSQTAFEDAPVTVQAEVGVTGYDGADIVGRLELIETAAPKPKTNAPARKASHFAAEQTLKAPRGGGKVTFRFQLRPEKTGVVFYRLRVSAKDEFAQFTKPETSREATLANNERIIVVDRGRGPYRVLYLSGRPNWEYKFLHRAVEFDDQVQLVGLIRIAKREPKFEFRGRTGESSNPLFRGFGNQSKEEIERYDQPVLVRLNTRDEFELRTGFPKHAEELFGYHAVIIDDLESEFFTADQMTLLQKFVSERGGGVLMLGGQESLGEGKYLRTPIGDMLPVYLDTRPEPMADGAFEFRFTREGWLEPWVRLRDNEAAEKKRLAEMPKFQVVNRTRDIKPGATVLATTSDGRHEYPALVAQRFGHGKTGVLTIGDFWHSGLGDETRSKDLGKAWRQIVRWLVADVPSRIELSNESAPGDSGEAVKLVAKVHDDKFLPLDNATVKLSVRQIGLGTSSGATNRPVAKSAPVALVAEPNTSEAGTYESAFAPRESAGYLAEAVVVNDAGAEVGRAETGWAAEFAAAEFASITPNHALLETIARKTGGEMVAASKLEQFAKELATKRAPITENWLRPLWHTPVMFLFALACFVGEWGLRRWKGLA